MFLHRGDRSKVAAHVVEAWEKWSGFHARSWARLDHPERFAWRAFKDVDGQLSFREVLQSKDAKKCESFAVLDGVFFDRVAGWYGVPPGFRSRVWAGVLLLHDFAWQGGREHSTICYHPDEPLALCHSARLAGRVQCLHCRAVWRCSDCWQEGERHVNCRGELG